MSIWKALGALFGLLLLVGVVLFARQTYTYYAAIRSGRANPLLEQKLESTVSRLIANKNVSPADLAALADPAAPSLGSASATLTLVEFLDYGCPSSYKVFQTVREAAVTYGDRVRLIIRDFPLEDLHTGATKAAAAARCAQEQGKFWAYHDKLFLLDQRSFTDADLSNVADEIGLESRAFAACLASDRVKTLVKNDQAAGLRAGVEGTPTFFFNGTKIQGAPSRDVLEYLIGRFLKN